MAVTTIKTIIVQIQDENGNWQDSAGYGFDTIAERAAQMETARPEAKRLGGRVVVRTEKTDDSDGTYTLEDKILLVATVTPVSIKATPLVWGRVAKRLDGEAWAVELVEAIRAALAA